MMIGSLALYVGLQVALVGARDTVDLADLHRAALSHDPRSAGYALHAQASEQRQRNIGTSWLPTFGFGIESSIQSAVPTPPLPGSPELPKERYQATLGIEQRIYDGGEARSLGRVEDAALLEAEAGLETDLYGLLGEVNEAFFAALSFAAQGQALEASMSSLEARLAEVRARVAEGAALPGDSAVLRAEILRAGQRRDELAANERAALASLSLLTGLDLTARDTLALPDLSPFVQQLRDRGDASELRLRPEFDRFASARQRAEAEEERQAARLRPRASVFGQLGYGRPGLDLFNRQPEEFWVGGLRLDWQPWTWGNVGREQEILRLRRATIDTEEAAFAQRLERAAVQQMETIERLEAAVAADDRIIELRELVERQASSQLREGVITAAVYADLEAALLEARVTREVHRIDLARAQATYLLTLGAELPE